MVPPLRDVLDPVGDEPWLVVDELVGDVCDALLTPDLHPVGRPELLSAAVVTDLVRMRDQALTEQAAAGVS